MKENTKFLNLRARYSLSSGTNDGHHLVTLTGHDQTLNMPAQAINSTKHCTEPTTNIDKNQFQGFSVHNAYLQNA